VIDSPLPQDAAGVGLIDRDPAGVQFGGDLAARGGGELVRVEAREIGLDLLPLAPLRLSIVRVLLLK